MNYIYYGDNLQILQDRDRMPDGSVDLIYIDPPFNTGKSQRRTRIKVRQSKNGTRVGFGGRMYEITRVLGTQDYNDRFGDFLSFLEPRLEEAYRVLADHGTLYFHIDYREVHSCKILLDRIFGRECFLNEIIWAYDYGGRSKTRWPAKHDNILVYVKHSENYTFNNTAVNDEISYVAPGFEGAISIFPADSWWHTIVATNGKERTGYPTQKPVEILDRILLASSNPGDLVLDFFAGSGTAGASCLNLGRRFVLIDNNPQAKEVMKKRFTHYRDKIQFIDLDPSATSILPAYVSAGFDPVQKQPFLK